LRELHLILPVAERVGQKASLPEVLGGAVRFGS
jgi:hypothetical protein